MFKELRNNYWRNFSTKRLIFRNILLIFILIYIISYLYRGF